MEAGIKLFAGLLRGVVWLCHSFRVLLALSLIIVSISSGDPEYETFRRKTFQGCNDVLGLLDHLSPQLWSGRSGDFVAKISSSERHQVTSSFGEQEHSVLLISFDLPPVRVFGEIHNARLVYVPGQEFIEKRADNTRRLPVINQIPLKIAASQIPDRSKVPRLGGVTAPELHMRDTIVRFDEGYFVLLPLDTVPPNAVSLFREFFKGRLFPELVVEKEQGNIPAGRYVLIPPQEYFGFLDRVLRGESSPWRPADDGSMHAREREALPRPGTEETSRGTFYVFDATGGVRVFSKDGRTYSYFPGGSLSITDKHGKPVPPKNGVAISPSVRKEGYSSHAEILRRQGVNVSESLDPVSAARRAIALNEQAILKNIDGQPQGPAELMRHMAALEEALFEWQEVRPPDPTRHRFDFTGSQPYHQRRALYEAMFSADDFDRLLPKTLRWTTFTDRALYQGVDDGDLFGSISRIYPFVVLREPEVPFNGPPSFSWRILDPDAIHLQALHAHIGELALTLDKEGYVSGGGLRVVYSPMTWLAESVEIVHDGIISVSDGTTHGLTDSEKNAILQSVEMYRKVLVRDREQEMVTLPRPSVTPRRFGVPAPQLR